MQTDRKSEIAQQIRQIFPGVIFLGNRDAAHVLNMSPDTLNRLRMDGLGPVYKKQNGLRGRVSYSIDAIAEYIVSLEVKTA